MLALFAGQGRLPDILASNLAASGDHVLRFSVGGDENPVTLNTIGSVLADLREKGCDRICLAGSIDRRSLSLDAPDEKTIALLPSLMTALGAPDGSALEKMHGLFEAQGFTVVGAHELCPHLLPGTGVLTQVQPEDLQTQDVARGLKVLETIGPADIGQGCVVENGQVLAVEALPGTDFMLASVARFRGDTPAGGVFVKAAKPGQDLRSDMPVIGPETAEAVISAGLAGIAILAGQVMVIDREQVLDRLNAAKRFLWVCP